MGLDRTVRENAEKVTQLVRAGQPLNPWLIEIDFDDKARSVQPVELRLGLPILIFELQQCGVEVERNNILNFVSNDLKTHQKEALSGYLTIVRHVVDPPPRRKSSGWFARMFTNPPSWTPPQPQWKWTSVNEIKASEDALIIQGYCCQKP